MTVSRCSLGYSDDMNKLKDETSPYLLQHADNPVDWHPWSDEALALAREQDKPILLSIGYSACHWCHVMAHESFEDDATAELMNTLFVNIKVDREERPDLDKIYQSAHQLIHRRPGGWPLTMFLSCEDQRPFFGGTYFPREARYGMPAFGDLCNKVAEHWRANRDGVRSDGAAMVAALNQIEPAQSAGDVELTEQPLSSVRDMLAEQCDQRNGGFGTAPKFPHPSNIDRLIRHWYNTSHSELPDTDAMFMAALALTRMADGGIYDQLGGGFCRYSVDESWTIPHFEKMLYDNGPLLALYSQMWQISGDDPYRQIANETADWVLRDMRAPDGAFYSTLDADSEGEEGKFYVWTPEQVRELISAESYPIFAAHFGLDRPANFEHEWHLRINASIDDLAKQFEMDVSRARSLIDGARAVLLTEREKRIWPGRDEKILASWNALMIRGLAIASRALGRQDLYLAGAASVDFIRENMVRDGKLQAVFKDGHARFDAYLDDYAFLLDATLELLQSHWVTDHLQFSIWLAEQLLERFEDKEHGGFFFTANDHEQLIHRSKPLSDEALPAGNAIAAFALNRLGHLLGDTRFIESAHRTLQAAWRAMEEFPHGHTAMITALEEHFRPPQIIIIRGATDAVTHWSEPISALYAPHRLVFAIPQCETDLPQSLALRKCETETVAYVCEGMSCSAPIASLEALAATLSAEH